MCAHHCAAEEAKQHQRVKELFAQYQDDPNMLQRIGDGMPTPMTTKKVLRLLRKLGLVEKPVSKKAIKVGGGSQRR